MSIKNKYLAALFKTVALAGFIHLALLAILAVINLDYSYFNVFSILEISKFAPGIEKGAVSFVIGTIISLGTYLFFLLRSKH